MLTDDELAKLARAACDRIDVTERWRDTAGRAFELDDVCWVESTPKGLRAQLVDGTAVFLSRGQEIGRLEKYATERRLTFQRTHNRVLVNTARVRSVQRQDDGFSLHFSGTVPPAPVSTSFAEATAISVGAGQTLDHLTPASPYAATIDELGLLFLGEEEAHRIDPGDSAAAEAWRDKWWIENFDSDTMYRYFRNKTNDDLDKTKIIRNGIWQRFLSVKWGMWVPDYGDTRGFYYHPVEDVLARNNLRSTSRDSNADPDSVSSHLRDMVIKYKLFDYADFDIPDPNRDLRCVGDRHPHLVVFAEKSGFIKVLMQLAKPYGASYCAVKGEPSAHAMEVFARDLKASFDVTRRTVHVFGITDVNPGGTSIAETLVEDLTAFGIPRIRYHRLVDPSLYEDWRITNFRKQLVTFRQKGNGPITPVGNDTLSYVTKARNWFERVLKSDSRFIKKRQLPAPDGRLETSIYGIQSNSARPETLSKRFHEAIAPYLDTPAPDPGGESPPLPGPTPRKSMATVGPGTRRR
jgi:hypothetical protein